MIRTKVVTVSSTPTSVIEPETVDSIPGQNIAVYNSGSSVVYVGGSDVSVDNGFPLAVGATISFDMRVTQDVYVVGTTGELRVLVEAYQ